MPQRIRPLAYTGCAVHCRRIVSCVIDLWKAKTYRAPLENDEMDDAITTVYDKYREECNIRNLLSNPTVAAKAREAWPGFSDDDFLTLLPQDKSSINFAYSYKVMLAEFRARGIAHMSLAEKQAHDRGEDYPSDRDFLDNINASGPGMDTLQAVYDRVVTALRDKVIKRGIEYRLIRLRQFMNKLFAMAYDLLAVNEEVDGVPMSNSSFREHVMQRIDQLVTRWVDEFLEHKLMHIFDNVVSEGFHAYVLNLYLASATFVGLDLQHPTPNKKKTDQGQPHQHEQDKHNSDVPLKDDQSTAAGYGHQLQQSQQPNQANKSTPQTDSIAIDSTLQAQMKSMALVMLNKDGLQSDLPDFLSITNTDYATMSVPLTSELVCYTDEFTCPSNMTPQQCSLPLTSSAHSDTVCWLLPLLCCLHCSQAQTVAVSMEAGQVPHHHTAGPGADGVPAQVPVHFERQSLLRGVSLPSWRREVIPDHSLHRSTACGHQTQDSTGREHSRECSNHCSSHRRKCSQYRFYDDKRSNEHRASSHA